MTPEDFSIAPFPPSEPPLEVLSELVVALRHPIAAINGALELTKLDSSLEMHLTSKEIVQGNFLLITAYINNIRKYLEEK